MSTEMASVRIVVLPARLWTPTGMESVIITAQTAVDWEQAMWTPTETESVIITAQTAVDWEQAMWTPTETESVTITAQMAAVEADEGVAAVDVGDKRI